MADPAEAEHEYGVKLVGLETFKDLDGLVLAVPHKVLRDQGWNRLFQTLSLGGIFIDVKSAIGRDNVPDRLSYWSL